MPDDFDSILGSRPTDAEDVLGARPQDGPVGSSPAADSFFSSNPLGRVMSAFGQGARQGWGADHGDPLTDSTMKEIQKLEGVGDDRFDYHGVKERAIKSANEAFIRPLVTLGERGARLVGATLGAVGGGVGQALGEVGEPLHNYAVSPTKDDYLGWQHIQRGVAGATSEILGIAQLGGGMEFAHPEVHSIEEARANGVIGEPEGNFYGTREPTKQDLEGRAEATANTGSVSTPPTVHDIARQIAPDVFQEYDNLQAHKDLLRTTLQNLSDNRDTSPEAADLQSKIDDILDKVNGVSSRLTQSAAARLADLEDQLDRHTTTDTPDMAQVRQDLLNADYRARDLSPSVAEAYKEASSRMPPEEAATAPTEPQDGEPQAPGTPPSPLPEDVSRANSEASDKIVQDAKKKFINAGRSEEESELLGQLVAQRYLTRARTLGRDPYQLYAQEFPNIRAGGRAAGPEGVTFHQDQLNRPTFFSQLRKQIETSGSNKASAKEWTNLLSNLKNKGVKQEEIDWSGLSELLYPYDETSISKQDILNHLDENSIKLSETQKHDLSPFIGEHPRYKSYNLPGAIDYRELLMTLPEKTDVTKLPEGWEVVPWEDWEPDEPRIQHLGAENATPYKYQVLDDQGDQRGLGNTPEEAIKDAHSGNTLISEDFKSPHWEEKNVLAHMRFDTRIDADGKKVLHIAEIQSDWHQKGRKHGYSNPEAVKAAEERLELAYKTKQEIEEKKEALWNRWESLKAEKDKLQYNDPEYKRLREEMDDAYKQHREENKKWDSAHTEYWEARREADSAKSSGRTPDAPFKNNWHELAFKRILRYAAENNFDKVAWDTGAVSADRYSLRKQIDELYYYSDNAHKVDAKSESKYHIQGYKNGEKTVDKNYIKASDLEDVVGKEIAERIIKEEGEQHPTDEATKVLKGVDLEVGGKGMKGFYDDILPKFVNKYVKKWGAKVEASELSLSPEARLENALSPVHNSEWKPLGKTSPVHSIEVTDKMKDSVLHEGQPLYQQKRGSLTLNNSRNTIRLFKEADASTAIHELGHQFLEELQKDAETEGVDPMVPADLKVVKDWLGLEDDDKITRRGHEQFARGFERYLREGRAPTSALAKVFRKFKEWLTQIYKKVGDLKAPITDDIRKVFNNMLTHTDQETTIIPESDADRGVTEPQPSVRDTGPVIGDSKSEKTVNQETPGPNTPIEKTATTHLDKAGNIRIDTLNSSDDVSSTLKQIAEWDNDHIAARRGKWTQRDVVDLAESAGLERSEVNLKKLEALSTQDGIPLAARIWGLRKMLIQSANHLKEMMEGDDGVAYAEALQRHLRIQDTVAGVTAEWGRAGMAFKDLAKEYEQAQQLSEFFQSTLGKTFDQVKRDMALGRHLQTPGQISKFAKDSMKPSLGHMAQEVFINAFLSGPITHTSYLISNKLLAIMSGIPETIVKAGIGAFHQALSGKRIDRAYFGEALQSMKVLGGEYSLLYGSRNGIKAAWKSFKAGQTVGLSGEGSFYDIGYKKAKRAGLEGEALTNSANNIARQLVSQYAYKKALDEGLDGPELITRARQIIDDPNSAKIVADEKLSTPFTQTKYIPGVAGTVLRSSSERLVAPIHSFDRTVNFEMHKAQLLYRRAIQDVAKSGDTSLDAVSRRLAVLHNNVPPEITAQARDAATNLTLMGQGGDLTKRLQNLTNWEVDLPILRQTQPLKFISPFVHVFSMIQKLGVIERSPIGLLSPTIRDQLMGKHGTAIQHEAISKMAVGVAAMYAIYGMYQNGDANGNADPDYRKAAVELRAKGLPNSIRMGNMSYSFDRMGAIGSLLKHGIAVAKAAEAMHNSTGTEDGLKAAMAAYFHDMWTNISEEGTLNSFSDIIEAMEGSDKKKADWVENFLLGGIPFGVGSTQVARLVDNTQRAPVTLGEKLQNKIPGMSSGLLPKYDVWGQPVPNKGFVGVYDSQVSNDPVDQALLQSKYYPAPVEKKILGVELSEEQHAEYAQKAGLTARMIITPLVTSSGWGQLSEKAKHDLMSNAFSAARQAGRAAVLADPKNKDLIQKSYDVLKGNK